MRPAGGSCFSPARVVLRCASVPAQYSDYVEPRTCNCRSELKQMKKISSLVKLHENYICPVGDPFVCTDKCHILPRAFKRLLRIQTKTTRTTAQRFS
jgi:hypothetical protein